MSSPVRPSVCLSLTFVHPVQAIQIFGNVCTPFGTLAICWQPGKILRRSSQGNPSVGGRELNTRGVAKYSDFWPIKRYISETVQDRSSVSINQFCCPRGLALASRTPHEGIDLRWQVLGLGTLGLGLERKFFAPKTQATWLLYVFSLLTLTVSHDSLPLLVYEWFTDLHVN